MDRELDQINVIPLVDVMLVLLVISTGQIPVNLAKAKEAGDRKDAPIVITLNAEGHLFVNDRPVTVDGLKETLRAESRESAVVVRADKTTLLERFVSLVDDVRGLGFQHVSLEVVRL